MIKFLPRSLLLRKSTWSMKDFNSSSADSLFFYPDQEGPNILSFTYALEGLCMTYKTLFLIKEIMIMIIYIWSTIYDFRANFHFSFG